MSERAASSSALGGTFSSLSANNAAASCLVGVVGVAVLVGAFARKLGAVASWSRVRRTHKVREVAQQEDSEVTPYVALSGSHES